MAIRSQCGLKIKNSHRFLSNTWGITTLHRIVDVSIIISNHCRRNSTDDVTIFSKWYTISIPIPDEFWFLVWKFRQQQKVERNKHENMGISNGKMHPHGHKVKTGIEIWNLQEIFYNELEGVKSTKFFSRLFNCHRY